MAGIRRQRRSSQGWGALLTRFASSDQTDVAFCRSEAISLASFYRWRSLLGQVTDARAYDDPDASHPDDRVETVISGNRKFGCCGP